MSDELSVAVVGASLQALLQGPCAATVPGSHVVVERPLYDVNAFGSKPLVSVFLYQVTPNAALRNRDLTTRDSSGAVITRPRAAVDLHYLLSFYGTDSSYEPQRLLGTVVRVLHEHPQLIREDLIAGIATAAELATCNLADTATEAVRVEPTSLSLDDLSRLWSTLLQTPYAPSVTYQIGPVFLDAQAQPAAGLPVREAVIDVSPLTTPVLLALTVMRGGIEVPGPAQPGDALRLSGSSFLGDGLDALIDGVPLGADVSGATDSQIDLPIPAGLPPGLHTIALSHSAMLGDPPAPHLANASSALQFSLAASFAVARSNVTHPSAGHTSATLTVTFTNPPRASQSLSVQLRQVPSPASVPPAAYSYDINLFQAAGPGATPDSPVPSVTVAVSNVAASKYLVVVVVDQVVSLLGTDAGGHYDAPSVDLS